MTPASSVTAPASPQDDRESAEGTGSTKQQQPADFNGGSLAPPKGPELGAKAAAAAALELQRDRQQSARRDTFDAAEDAAVQAALVPKGTCAKQALSPPVTRSRKAANLESISSCRHSSNSSVSAPQRDGARPGDRSSSVPPSPSAQ